MERISCDFDSLRNLHDCANDLLCSPITQQQAVVYHRHEKWVEEVCEASLRMLDVCGITRDVLLLVKEHLQESQSALRRRCIRDHSGMEKRTTAYNASINKTMKKMHRCLEALKGMERNSDLPLNLDVDPNLMVVITVIREVRTTTILVVESVLSFLSVSKPKLRSKKRSFIFNCIGRKQVVDKSEKNYEPDILNVHNFSAKSRLFGESSGSKHLEALEGIIEGFEVELECMFRRLIQTRFSLLNIFNN